ncbi:hypothetical protein LC607_17890 [Nostoc sp. CHAB 5824]|nr:hypothetical protein [Nostoc sp. CHAB 5824]
MSATITVLLNIKDNPELVNQLIEAVQSLSQVQQSRLPLIQSWDEFKALIKRFDRQLFPLIQGFTLNSGNSDKGDLSCEVELRDPLAKLWIDSYKRVAVTISPRGNEYKELEGMEVSTKPDYLIEAESSTPEERDLESLEFKESILAARAANHES